jgi:uncharacterized membrane protein (DUF373 family)
MPVISATERPPKVHFVTADPSALVIRLWFKPVSFSVKTVIYLSPHFLVAVDQMLQMFGLFLIILLGLELLEMVKAFFQEDVIHVEVVLIVALIALARKVIILELHEPTAGILAGMAALILSVAGSYRLIMRFLSEKK